MDYQKLVEFYNVHNLLPSTKSDEELWAYFARMDYRKNLIMEYDTEFNIIGYCEFWRINCEQLGKIMVYGASNINEEETTSGEIAFVANVAVHPEHKRYVFKSMKAKFFLMNYNCKFFCGDSRRRVHHHTFNIYPRTEMISKYLTTEVINHG